MVQKGKERRRKAIMAAVKKELKLRKVFVAPEMLRKIAEAITPSKYYMIEVIHNMAEANERLTLKDFDTRDEMVDTRIKERGTAVFGHVRFGISRYFYNYEFDSGESRGEACDFNPDKPFAVLIQHYESEYGGGSDSEDNINTIVIYAPNRKICETGYAAGANGGRVGSCRPSYNLPNAEG